MGCFNTLRVPCPRCGEPAEFQSKAGDCDMREFSLADAPPVILGDLADERHTCDMCGATFVLVVRTLAQAVETCGLPAED